MAEFVEDCLTQVEAEEPPESETVKLHESIKSFCAKRERQTNTGVSEWDMAYCKALAQAVKKHQRRVRRERRKRNEPEPEPPADMKAVCRQLEAQCRDDPEQCWDPYCFDDYRCTDCPSAVLVFADGTSSPQVCSDRGECKLGWKSDWGKNGYCACEGLYRGRACTRLDRVIQFDFFEPVMNQSRLDAP
ncbi:MAG: hypothetical protein KVP17_004241 [Porospora cf. gigantea B]|uniref:uncharacterized protein n=2 Tax=Porospora cf. gigantea B TaxID=2853592 RepID=UPI0035718A1D|nr:MAG: hypothetical protein KVP17_004241 [Porospora cf. gigantea B]